MHEINYIISLLNNKLFLRKTCTIYLGKRCVANIIFNENSNIIYIYTYN